MRHLRLAFALALVVLPAALLATTSGRADDDEEPTLPWNPFTEAKEGDWECLLFQSGMPGAPAKTHSSTWRVKKVTDDLVSVDFETAGPNATKPEVLHRTFKRNGTLTLREYFMLKESEKLVLVNSTKRTFTLQGHAFEGVQLETVRSGGTLAGKLNVVFSKEVKGSGVVVIEALLDTGRLRQHMLAGFGDANKKLWGKTAEEIPVVSNETPFPHNLYQDRLHGFSIHAPGFPEIQEHQVAQTFAYQGGRTTYAVLVQGDPTPRKEFRAKSLDLIKEAHYEVVKDEELKISGKDALQLEYTGTVPTPSGNVDARMIDLLIFRDAHVIDIRVSAPAKQFDGGDLEKSIRAALAGVRLIDRSDGGDHKGEGPGVYFDHTYGFKLPLPELPKVEEGGAQTVVEFQGPVELNGNNSRVAVSVLDKVQTREDYEIPEIEGLEIVSKKKVEVSGRKALRVETKATVNGKPVQGLSLIVFDKARTYVVDASGAKAAWDEWGPAFRQAVESFKLDP